MPPLPAKNKIPPAEEWISVKHPQLTQPEVTPRVTREAFDQSYKDLGWVEIDGTSSSSPNAVEIPAESAPAPRSASSAGGN